MPRGIRVALWGAIKLLISAAIVVLTTLLHSQAQTVIRPTTTLAELTANNTSASSSIRNRIGENATPGNVSKIPLRTLLYPEANTKIYAHLMGWFGSPDHIKVGYISSDPAQIRSQIEDMVSRGISGVIASWDTNKMVQKTVPRVLREAERHPGFEFAIELEAFGYRRYAKTMGNDITSKVLDDLARAATEFESSSSYMRIGGRPVIFVFGLERYYVDWGRVRAEAAGNPLFIFRNPSAFAKSYSDGGFAWSEKSKTDPSDMMLGYLDEFYKTALAHPGKIAFGSAYAGFDDSLATWGNNKIMDRHCGQTWLDSFARAGRFYSSSKQLPYLRLVTWNDYEEGTAIEPGVDNCVTISASVEGSKLRWSLTGNVRTLDHFTVYISTDGQNLMPLNELPADARSLDLASLDFAPGTYTLYVRAVAKAGILNKISGAVKYVPGSRASTMVLPVPTSFGSAPVSVSAHTSAPARFRWDAVIL